MSLHNKPEFMKYKGNKRRTLKRKGSRKSSRTLKSKKSRRSHHRRRRGYSGGAASYLQNMTDKMKVFITRMHDLAKEKSDTNIGQAAQESANRIIQETYNSGNLDKVADAIDKGLTSRDEIINHFIVLKEVMEIKVNAVWHVMFDAAVLGYINKFMQKISLSKYSEELFDPAVQAILRSLKLRVRTISLNRTFNPVVGIKGNSSLLLADRKIVQTPSGAVDLTSKAAKMHPDLEQQMGKVNIGSDSDVSYKEFIENAENILAHDGSSGAAATLALSASSELLKAPTAPAPATKAPSAAASARPRTATRVPTVASVARPTTATRVPTATRAVPDASSKKQPFDFGLMRTLGDDKTKRAEIYSGYKALNK
jgi:hypothetical protein